jgi:hypothetical protein
VIKKESSRNEIGVRRRSSHRTCQWIECDCPRRECVGENKCGRIDFWMVVLIREMANTGRKVLRVGSQELCYSSEKAQQTVVYGCIMGFWNSRET